MLSVMATKDVDDQLAAGPATGVDRVADSGDERADPRSRHAGAMPTALRPIAAGLRAWRVWAVPALISVTVGAVELLRGGEMWWEAAITGWAIFAVGLVAAGAARDASIGDWWRRTLLSSVAVSWTALITTSGAGRLDWLFISGVAVFILGVESSEHVGERFRDAIRALLDRGILQMSEAEQNEYWRRSSGIARRWQTVTAAVVGSLIFLGWIIAFRDYVPELLTRRPFGIVFETVAGIVAGQRLGRMFAYGNGWRLLNVTPGKLTLVPGHPDGAAGIKPMGSFYFRQSLVASLPAAYLAVWWFLIPAWPGYTTWRPVYLSLLPFAIAFEVLAFFVPMRAIHQVMAVQRRLFIAEADRLTPRIAAAQAAQAERAGTSGGSDEAGKSLAVLLERYQTLRQVPSWPVDRSLRRWFSLNNIALVLPFLGYLLGNADFWAKVGDAIGGIKH